MIVLLGGIAAIVAIEWRGVETLLFGGGLAAIGLVGYVVGQARRN